MILIVADVAPFLITSCMGMNEAPAALGGDFTAETEGTKWAPAALGGVETVVVVVAVVTGAWDVVALVDVVLPTAFSWACSTWADGDTVTEETKQTQCYTGPKLRLLFTPSWWLCLHHALYMIGPSPSGTNCFFGDKTSSILIKIALGILILFVYLKSHRLKRGIWK